MSDDTQLTIDGSTLDDTLAVMTSGRVIRPFNRMIGEVVDEYKLEATDDGLHVRAVDAPNVMYVDATLPASELDSLSIDGDETAIGVSTDGFARALSDARYGKSTDDPVTLTADGATLETVVDREYADVPATVTDRAELIDPAALRSQPDMIDVDRVSFPLPPDAFIDVVSSFTDSQHISIRVAEGGIVTFGGRTDTHAREIELDVNADTDGVAETVFSRSYLQTIASGLKTGYAESATLHVKDDFPLSVMCDTEQGLHVEYTVAPRVKRDAP